MNECWAALTFLEWLRVICGGQAQNGMHLTQVQWLAVLCIPSLSTQLLPSLSESIINVAPSVITMHLWAPIFLIRGWGRLLVNESCCQAHGCVRTWVEVPHPSGSGTLWFPWVEEHRLDSVSLGGKWFRWCTALMEFRMKPQPLVWHSRPYQAWFLWG